MPGHEVAPTEVPPAEPSPTAALTLPPQPRVADAAWKAMLDRNVIVQTGSGEISGKLVSITEDEAVLVDDTGNVTTVRRAEVSSLKLREATPAPPAATTPAAQPATTTDKDEKDGEAEDNKPRHRLGLFTSHGVAYAHWYRRNRFGDGAATYALDLGVGVNFSERHGLYLLLGGMVGAHGLDRPTNGHYGHVAAAFRIKRKYIAFIPGIGAGFTALQDPDGGWKRYAGLALPFKLMGLIPLPKELFLGIGVGWDLAFLQDRHVFNGISGQITVGRW